MGTPSAAEDTQSIVDPVFQLASQIVRVLNTIVLVAALVILFLVGAYIYALVGMDPNSAARVSAMADVQRIMLQVWDRLVPIGEQVLRFVAPVVIILLAILGLRALARSGTAPFDFSKIASDLPSALALFIVVTICLLPLAGIGIPDVLNNVALVVVGFYFGRREGAVK